MYRLSEMDQLKQEVAGLKKTVKKFVDLTDELMKMLEDEEDAPPSE